MVKHGYKGAYVLIPDVRFKNEAKSIKKLGGTIVHLDRQTDEDVGVGSHSSEKGIPDRLIDYKIKNISTLEELNKVTVRTLTSLLPWAADYTQIMDDLGTLPATEEDDSADQELLTESN
jgi:hypothetical protein